MLELIPSEDMTELEEGARESEIEKIIERTVTRTVEVLESRGLLRDADYAAYNDAKEIFANYYADGEVDQNVTYAMKIHRFDPYYKIIELYHKDKMTLADIAKDYRVSVRTICRNMRRLSIAIYNELI